MRQRNNFGLRPWPRRIRILMYDRFTDRARKVMRLAKLEATRLRHASIGTEHIMLGLIHEPSGAAGVLLQKLDVDLRAIRIDVEKIVHIDLDMVPMGKRPFTPRTNEVIEFAMDEAMTLGDNYVGTEHLLPGLLRDTDGVACFVLSLQSLTLEKVRDEVRNLRDRGVEPAEPDTKPKDPS